MSSKTVTVQCPHCQATTTVQVPDREKPAGAVWKAADAVRVTCGNPTCRKDFVVDIPM